MAEQKIFAGPRIRRIRTGLDLSQTAMAAELGISPSYLNLIERNQRPLTVQLLLKLTSIYNVDLEALQGAGDEGVMAQLREVFSDPLLAREIPDKAELAELAEATPNAAAAMVKLFRAYRESQERLSDLSRLMVSQGNEVLSAEARLPADELRDVFERKSNYIPALERAAEKLLSELGPREDLMNNLKAWLYDNFGLGVQVLPVNDMPNWRRRFDRHNNRLFLSERLSPGDRLEEVAIEVALLHSRELIDEEVAFLKLGSNEAERLARFEFARLMALAVMMPYERYLSTARKLRYDINLLRSRFSVTFAQAAWRLTTLNRQGQAGLPVFVMEVDLAGNRLRRAGANGFPFTRFGGDCARLIVHHAFTSPGEVFAELVTTPEEASFVTIGRTVEGLRSGFFDRPMRTALLVGFDVEHAGEIVYGDGLVGVSARAATLIGPSCRLCERQGCVARAEPPVTRPLGLDEMVRGISVYDFH